MSTKLFERKSLIYVWMLTYIEQTEQKQLFTQKYTIKVRLSKLFLEWNINEQRRLNYSDLLNQVYNNLKIRNKSTLYCIKNRPRGTYYRKCYTVLTVVLWHFFSNRKPLLLSDTDKKQKLFLKKQVIKGRVNSWTQGYNARWHYSALLWLQILLKPPQFLSFVVREVNVGIFFFSCSALST